MKLLANEILTQLWLDAPEGSDADDILFNARMYIIIGEEQYKIWSKAQYTNNTTGFIFGGAHNGCHN